METRSRPSNPEAVASMRAAWSEISRSGIAGPSAARSGEPSAGPAMEAIDDLVARHGEPHRHYHTAEHVMWVLRHVDRLLADGGGCDRLVIVAAALFHDAVYDPRSANNEADSAVLARRWLVAIGWTDERVRAVERMIVATAGHSPSSLDEAVLLDADLAVLGSDRDGYERYVADVRAEYAHVSDPDWRTGRSAVLRGFLDRPAIYTTARMAAEREQHARDNMTDELVRLMPARDRRSPPV